MKKTNLFLLLLGLFLSFSITSCKPDEDEGQYKEINDWIGSKMADYYLWTDKINSDLLHQDGYEEPITYFNSLLYNTEDYWSRITPDYNALMSDLQGTPVSMGYAPLFGRFTGTDNVFIIVAYVYENSPAGNAGLERGDIIVRINNIQLTTTNYQSLFYEYTQKLSLASYSPSTNTLYDMGESLSMTMAVVNVNPVLHSEVINKEGKNIGYIAISEFIDPTVFSTKVGEAFSDFVGAGVNELIIDLRYNGGGYVSSAVWLASALAPINVVDNGSKFIDVDYNANLQSGAQQAGHDRYNFVSNDLNLNLDKVYFLTGQNTASASEMVISGLQPFMEVVTIGETTHGKYVGSTVFPDPEENVSHNYGIMPIILAYTNIDGASVKGGIYPTAEVEDNLIEAVAFGDQTDALLNQALVMITGIGKSGVKSTANYPAFDRILSNSQKLRMNLIED